MQEYEVPLGLHQAMVVVANEERRSLPTQPITEAYDHYASLAPYFANAQETIFSLTDRLAFVTFPTAAGSLRLVHHTRPSSDIVRVFLEHDSHTIEGYHFDKDGLFAAFQLNTDDEMLFSLMPSRNPDHVRALLHFVEQKQDLLLPEHEQYRKDCANENIEHILGLIHDKL